MTQSEALELIAAEGLPLDETTDRIIELCEGWPAALHLVALAFSRGEREWASFAIGGDARFMTDYLADEVVKGLSRSPIRVLDEDFGPRPAERAAVRCRPRDRPGLPVAFARSRTATHLVHAVDPVGDWFRTNRVVRDALNVALRREATPDTIIGLHERAAAWYESQEMPDAAIHHARMAHDAPRFARLLGQLMRTRYAAGGASLVQGWMAWLSSASSLDQFP